MKAQTIACGTAGCMMLGVPFYGYLSDYCRCDGCRFPLVPLATAMAVEAFYRARILMGKARAEHERRNLDTDEAWRSMSGEGMSDYYLP